MDRGQAWEIVCEFVKSDSLRRHALAVETCVTAYARKLGEDGNDPRFIRTVHGVGYAFKE